MTFRARLLNLWLRNFERPALARMPVTPPSLIRKRFAFQARWLFRPPRGATINPIAIAGFPALAVGPETTARILYFHGGGYSFGSPATHQGLIARLSARAGYQAILPSYPLAPEHPYPAGPDAAVTVYRAMAAQGRPIILGGDSAGGGLVLSLLASICALGLPQPVATFVFSPWTDLSLSGRSLTANAGRDVLFPAARMPQARDLYLAGADPADPRASPLFAAFPGAGPVHIWVGDTELLLDDSTRIAVHLRQQGVTCQITVARDLPHVWPLFPGWLLPESDQTIDAVAHFIQDSLAPTNR